MPRFRASSLGMRFSWIQEFGISTFTGRTPNGLWPVVSASTSIAYGMISPAIPPSPMRPPETFLRPPMRGRVGCGLGSLSSRLFLRTPRKLQFVWLKAFMMHPLMRIVFISLLAAQATPNTVWAQVKAVPPLSGVIGKVQSVTDSSIDVQTGSGVVHVNIKQPLSTYKQIPSDLSHVASTSYIGVASTEQADGKEVAKQIIIFPEELRGAAEGSVLTDPPGATTHSRMTNGSISRPAVSHSRMTNGTVQKGSGTTLLVQYQDGSKTISVPPNVPVTEVAPEKVAFAEGDTVYVATEKLPDGTLTTNKILVIAPAVSPNTKQ